MEALRPRSGPLAAAGLSFFVSFPSFSSFYFSRLDVLLPCLKKSPFDKEKLVVFSMNICSLVDAGEPIDGFMRMLSYNIVDRR
jgi:hypothetical protein